MEHFQDVPATAALACGAASHSATQCSPFAAAALVSVNVRPYRDTREMEFAVSGLVVV